MQERKFRGIGWHVSEKGQKFERVWPGLGFFFRDGESFPVTSYMTDYYDVVKAIIERRNQLKNFGKSGTIVFDIEGKGWEDQFIFGPDAY